MRRRDVRENRQHRGRLKAEIASSAGQHDAEWCRAQLFDLVGAWDAADGVQRTRLLAGLLEHIEARADPSSGVHLVAVPRPGWRSFFEQILPLERETGLQAPSGKTRVEFTYRLTAAS